jgi:radical SAM superfamily enzyme YgiQ (UPF0313 family)
MGCVVISVGFESAVPRILKYLKCGTTTAEANERALKLAERAGVIMGGSFIFGTPSKTFEEMKQTLRWFERHNELKFFGINTIVPFPGTAVWRLSGQLKLLPDKVDYERLVAPTNIPKSTYIIDRSIDAKIFNRFMVHTGRIAWILTQTRLNRSFWGMSHFATWWWMWLLHPRKMVNIFKNVAANLEVTC